MAADARKTALFIINTVDKGRKTLDQTLEDVFEKDGRFSHKDISFIYVLVYGVLRWKKRLDRIIENFSDTRFSGIEHRVLNVLRIGLFQIVYLDKVPVSAAVNTSVEMAKSFTAPWTVKFVNALLRRAAREYKNVTFPDMEKGSVSALSINKSFPEWLIKRWLDRFGLQETTALCDAVNTIPPITVRTNSLKTTRESLVDSVRPYVRHIDITDYAPEGVFFVNPKAAVSDMAAFKDGWFQVQDEAAQLVTYLLNPQPGETILDACAGLGGKTGHIGQLMKNSGSITAVDKDKKKLLKLKSEMKRLGVLTVKTSVCDLDMPLNGKAAGQSFGMFDRILLDAPCSGIGVIRRNPDAKWSTSKKNLRRYQEKQVKYLCNLSDHVKPSGILVYAVCSTEPEENEDVVKRFLNKNSRFDIEKNFVGLSPNIRSLVDGNGYFKTSPYYNKMDGFFSVRFKRIK